MNEQTMDQWLTPAQVAEHLQVKTRTLQDWRSRKIGPKWSKQGQIVRYQESDVDEWMRGGK